ncbi:MAG: hypothetical protein CMH41_00355 [Micrococcales bacterium]|nr:hypothetical protein [Micrococcales bacterium]
MLLADAGSATVCPALQTLVVPYRCVKHAFMAAKRGSWKQIASSVAVPLGEYLVPTVIVFWTIPPSTTLRGRAVCLTVVVPNGICVSVQKLVGNFSASFVPPTETRILPRAKPWLWNANP